MTWKRHIPEKGRIIEISSIPTLIAPRNVYSGVAGDPVAGRPVMIMSHGAQMVLSKPWRYDGEGEDAWRERYWED